MYICIYVYIYIYIYIYIYMYIYESLPVHPSTNSSQVGLIPVRIHPTFSFINKNKSF